MCRTGNTSASVVSHTGASSSGMNTSEMNSSGRMDAFTIAGAASAFGMTVVTASPSVQNVAAAIASVSSTAGSVFVGSSTPKASQPAPATMITNSAVSSTEWMILPARYDQLGRGVPRTRFSSPPSLANVMPMATFVYVAPTTAKTMMPGT